MKDKKEMSSEKYRKMAEDKSVPQEARNMFLDKANEMEKKEYDKSRKKDVNGHKWKGMM
jgi:hypothetical protein